MVEHPEKASSLPTTRRSLVLPAFAGLDITSTVEEVDAPRRIVWGGPAQGIVAVHAWTLDEQDGAVLVRTEESCEGEPVAAQREALQAALDGSLRSRPENLKRTAESRGGE